jgi:hypothetical protein
MIEDEVPVAWIVVPDEAVATTIIGCPCDEAERSVLVYVAIYVPIRIFALEELFGLSRLRYRHLHL